MTTMRPGRPGREAGGDTAGRPDGASRERRCLHEAASVLLQRDQSLQTAFRRVVALIPHAFHAPDTTSAAISLGDLRVITPGHEDAAPSIPSVFRCGSGRTGTVEVRLRPPAEDGVEGASRESSVSAFTREQRLLVDSLAMLLQTFCTSHDRTDRIERERDERARTAERRGALGRLTTFGELAGGIAHDINNLLLPILINVELALSGAPQALRTPLREIQEAARQGGDLTRKLLTLAGKQPLRRSDVDLGALVHGAMPVLRRRVPETVEVQVTVDPGLPLVHADPTQVEHVLANLVLNARDAVEASGHIDVSVHARSEGVAVETERNAESGPYVYLTVADDGHGIPEKIVGKVFEPFFTTKDETAHTGLGLSSVLGVVEQHAGAITVGKSARGGACFSVGLPIRDRAGASEANDGAPSTDGMDTAPAAGVGGEKAPEPSPTVGRGRTVLVADDDPAVRRVMSRVLHSYGYDVLEAEDGRAALKVLESRADDVDLIISDMVMPGMSGLELRDALTKRGVDVPMLFASGYSWSALDAQGIDAEDVRILHKPFTPSQLIGAVVRADSGASP